MNQQQPDAPRVAILLYERLTALDAIGPYDVLTRVPGAEVLLVGRHGGTVTTEQGTLGLTANATLDEVDDVDVVVVPGGPGQVALMDDEILHRWLRAIDRRSHFTTSVCTGSLVLAAAGLLEGRTATSHWLALEQLERFGVRASTDRVVEDGHYLTAAGVSSGIDLALTLADRLAGSTIAQAIQLGIEYDPQPPFDAGSPATAPHEVVAMLRARSRFVLEGA